MKTSWKSALGICLGAPAVALGWALLEAEWYALRHYRVPVLPKGAAPLRLLHLSDIHLRAGQTRKIEWLRSLANTRPDLVITTGDNWSQLHVLPELQHALEPLLKFPGAYVYGSNDYFAPGKSNPLRYLLPDPRKGVSRRYLPSQMPIQQLDELLSRAGWLNLNNARGELEVGDLNISFVGTDDAHIDRDRMPEPKPGQSDDLHLAVTHAPYLRVLDRFVADQADLILAGHTHGGQICLPAYGALVTNCDLPTQYARGLNRWADADGGEQTWLHVSAGLGTAPSTPIRFACRPEASLLTLVARDS